MANSVTHRKHRDFREFVVGKYSLLGDSRVHIKYNSEDEIIFIEVAQKNSRDKWIPNPWFSKDYLVIGNTNGFYIFKTPKLKSFVETHTDWIKTYRNQTKGLVLQKNIAKALCLKRTKT